MTSILSQMAFTIVNQMHTMIAYWNADERCIFSNLAYRSWFNKTPEEMSLISLQELMGPALYSLNRPHIQGALRGEKQIFQRQLTSASGVTHHFAINYTPDVSHSSVLGFSVNVTELPPPLHPREWLPICSSCKDIQTPWGEWHSLEDYFTRHSGVSFTHSLCPKCLPHYFPGNDGSVKTV